MSRLLGVSRNAYYRYCQRQRERLPNAEHEAMIEAVKEVAQSSDKSYGSRRMKHALNALGYRISLNNDVNANTALSFDITPRYSQQQLCAKFGLWL